MISPSMAAAEPATARGRPLRITYLIGSLDVGGAERQLVRLVNALDPERFEPSIVTFLAGGPLEGDLRPGIRVTHLSWRTLDERRRRGQRGFLVQGLWLLIRLYRALRADRPDVLHAYLPAAYMLGGLSGWAARIPVIIAGRRGLTSYHSYPQGRLRLMARLANRVIAVHLCNSEAVRAYAIEREGLRPDRTLVIPNGIDPPDGPAPDLKPSWRAPVTAAMIANFFPYKGHETVLHAVRLVASKRSGFRLVLFGDGLERGRVETLRDELGLAGSIVFAGRRPDAAAYLPGFDFLLLASTQEGLPNAVMEAMACGVPPLATAVGGVPELVGHQVSGLLVPPSDSVSMADAITWMIDHPDERRRMGEAARARMERSFSTEGMVARTEDLYETLTHDGRLRRRRPS
ncbi:MAG TPA: glycosyltransferase [Terriglobales bacterium]|nr:glycosyltransferase [Terriglobales bacterium]